jgi:hypothetical protein
MHQHGYHPVQNKKKLGDLLKPAGHVGEALMDNAFSVLLFSPVSRKSAYLSAITHCTFSPF